MLKKVAKIVGGIVYANAAEWVLHKYVLHEAGKKKESPFSFHWHDHHRNCRKNNYRDPDYETLNLEMNAQGKEIMSLVALALIHFPVIFVMPEFYGMLIVSAIAYYFVHKYSHLNPEWGKKWVKWHYDHHMGMNQNANWCVTFPLFDYIMGTRIKYG